MARRDKSRETVNRLVVGYAGVGEPWRGTGKWGVIFNGYRASLQGEENVELGESSAVWSAMALGVSDTSSRGRLTSREKENLPQYR